MISRWWRNHCNQYDVISMIISLISALGKQQKRVLFSFVPLVVQPRLRPNEQSVGQRYSSVTTWWTACSELKRSHRKGEVDPCNYCLKSNKQQGTHVSKYYRGGYQPGKDKYMKTKRHQQVLGIWKEGQRLFKKASQKMAPSSFEEKIPSRPGEDIPSRRNTLRPRRRIVWVTQKQGHVSWW